MGLYEWTGSALFFHGLLNILKTKYKFHKQAGSMLSTHCVLSVAKLFMKANSCDTIRLAILECTLYLVYFICSFVFCFL